MGIINHDLRKKNQALFGKMSAIFCMLSTKRALYPSKSTSVICLPQSRNPSEAGHVPNATVKVDRDKLAALMTPDALTLLTLLTLLKR